jgi:hypothetical protein
MNFQTITTVVVGFNRNITNTTLQDHRPPQVYLQPKKHHLYGCGGGHIRIGERMISRSQYIIPRCQ